MSIYSDPFCLIRRPDYKHPFTEAGGGGGGLSGSGFKGFQVSGWEFGIEGVGCGV